MSTRYGITFTGLILASGAGVFCGSVPVGYLAMLATVFTDPSPLAALPGALVIGALAGVVVAYGTRKTLRPKMPQRYKRFVLAGLIAMPGYFFLGQIDNLAASDAPAQWAICFILGCGITGGVVYYRWRKRLSVESHARRAAEYRARQQSATS
ncbi:hypothetical protein [Amycolatopsis sp. lyj-112]|uniref:hypothetical protein n=1 Tax=Amycolatopsis sp. lyj-112 TaxID=2789288 RepID=UPI00397AF16B